MHVNMADIRRETTQQETQFKKQSNTHDNECVCGRGIPEPRRHHKFLLLYTCMLTAADAFCHTLKSQDARRAYTYIHTYIHTPVQAEKREREREGEERESERCIQSS